MTQDKITISLKELINLRKYFVKLSSENVQLQHDMLTVKEGLNKISGAIIKLERFVSETEEELTRTQRRIGQVVKYLENKEEEHRYIDKTVVEKIEHEAENGVEADNEITRQRDENSVLFFIMPESDGAKPGSGDDSTRQTRRQMLLTIDEEKVLLAYLEKRGASIKQQDYERLLKDISNLLVSAPKNAIAIEVKKLDSNSSGNTLELCYHIKVKEDVSQANFLYFEYPS
ncbi:MAG: hypothetical protein GY765_07980 [bacterium]|nr:hypothetical protein [bacterium]